MFPTEEDPERKLPREKNHKGGANLRGLTAAAASKDHKALDGLTESDVLKAFGLTEKQVRNFTETGTCPI